MMPLVRRFALFGAMLGIAVGVVRAQALTPREPSEIRMPTVDSVVLAGDTVAALDLLQKIIADDDRNAAAWHRQGELALLLARPPGTRIKFNARTIRYSDLADSALARAVYLAPDSARYHLTFGTYRATFVSGIAANASFRRGLAAARRLEDSTMVEEIAIQLGLRNWTTFDGYVGRRSIEDVSLEELVSDTAIKEEVDRIVEYYFPRGQSMSGERYFLAARDFFLTALAARPDSRRAWRYACLTLLMLEAWEELEAATAVRIGVEPSDAWAWLSRGLAFHWQGRERESAEAFERGLALLEPMERERLTRLTRLLRPSDAERIASLGEPQRLATELLFWIAGDPLSITAENEHWLEFLSRVTYAELMFSVDEFTVHGADSPRGEVFVRYGKPRDVLMSRSMGQHQSVWRYESGLDFFFETGRSRVVNEDKFDYLRKKFEYEPYSFANVHVTRTMDTIPVAVTRFRGDADSTDALVNAEIPVGRLGRGIDLQNGTLRMGFLTFSGSAIRRDTSSRIVRFTQDTSSASERHAWTARFASRDVGYRVEAHQVESGRGARSLGSILAISHDGFGMSDILIADRLRSTVSAPERWMDLEIEPGTGPLRAGEDLALAWETYDLAADSTRSSAYSVEISLVRTDGSRLGRAIARVIGGTLGRGEGRERDDRVAVSFDRRVPARPVTLDYLTLDLSDLDPGRYRLTITVTDAVRNVSTESTRELEIVQ